MGKVKLFHASIEALWQDPKYEAPSTLKTALPATSDNHSNPQRTQAWEAVPGIIDNLLWHSRKTLTIDQGPANIWYYGESLRPLIAHYDVAPRHRAYPTYYGPFSDPSRIDESRPSDPLWLRPFMLGSTNTTHVGQETSAKELVSAYAGSAAWSPHELRLLCQTFAFRAIEFFTFNDPLPRFALAVSHKFQELRLAGRPWFAQMLEHEVCNAFLFAWTSDRYSVNAYTAQNPQYIIGALNLAKLLGDLFFFGLISPSAVIFALDALCKKLCSLQHIEALRHLIIHSGYALCQDKMIWYSHMFAVTSSIASYLSGYRVDDHLATGGGREAAIRHYDEIMFFVDQGLQYFEHLVGRDA